jgi:hypothetical protein
LIVPAIGADETPKHFPLTVLTVLTVRAVRSLDLTLP